MNHRSIPLRLRLLVAFLTVTGLSVAAVSGIASTRAHDSLIASTGQRLRARAESEARSVGAVLDNQLVRLRALALGRALIAQATIQNQGYRGDPRAAVAAADARWAEASEADGLVIGVTRSLLARDLRASALLDPDTLELMLTDRHGALVAAAAAPSDYNQSDEEWWAVAAERGVYISPPIYDDSAADYGLIIAVAVREPGTDGLVGVLRSTYRVEAIGELLGAARFGATGRAELLLNGGRLTIADSGERPVPQPDQAVIGRARGSEYAVGEITGAERVLALAPVRGSPQVVALGWEVLLLQSEAEALIPVSEARTGALLSALVVLALAAAAGLGLAELILRPIGRITAAAERIAAGDLAQRLNLAARDEIGRLAGSFDRMAESLSDRIAAEQAAQADRLALQAEVIAAQDRRIEELAAPVIPLGEHTLLLPLIGAVDERRADYVLRTLLAAVAESRARRVLLDLTGVRDVDGRVAQALLRAASAVRLLGAQVALVGLRPAAARAIVGLDIDLGELPVYASLQAALAAGPEAVRGRG